MQLHETQHLVRSIFRGLPHLLLGGVPPERAGERRLAVRRLGVEPRGDLQLTCDAFANGEPIPIRYTADGGSAEPPLRFQGAPRGARSLALLVEDPDAPTPRPFVHWLVYAIPPSATSIDAAHAGGCVDRFLVELAPVVADRLDLAFEPRRVLERSALLGAERFQLLVACLEGIEICGWGLGLRRRRRRLR